MISPHMALLLQSWRKYLIFASTPVVMVVCYPLLICESAQWLLTRKQYDKAVLCLKRIAKFNGRVVEENVYVQFVEHYQQKMAQEEKLKNEDTFWGIFTKPRVRKYFIILVVKR